MSAYLPLFNQGEFFTHLLSTRAWPLPSWEIACDQINYVFSQLHSALLYRVNQHMYFTFPFQPALPCIAKGELLNHFERRKHAFFLRYFLEVCCKLEATIESMKQMGGMVVYQKLFPLILEVTRLRSVLTLITHIVHPLPSALNQAAQAPLPPVRLVSLTYEENTQQLNHNAPEVVPSLIEQAPQAKPLVRLVSLTYEENNNLQSNESLPCASSTGKPKFSKKKVLLELKKDRVKSNSVSSSGSSGYSTASESQQSDEECEHEKKKDCFSTDEEDFSAYSQEILKLTTTNSPSTSTISSSTSSSGYPSSSTSPSLSSEEEITTEIIKEMQLGIAEGVFTILGEL